MLRGLNAERSERSTNAASCHNPVITQERSAFICIVFVHIDRILGSMLQFREGIQLCE